MRHSLIWFFVILLTPTLTFPQSDKWLIRKFKNADTVLLISHKLITGSTDEAVDIKGNPISLPELFIKGKLNLDILTEKLIIRNKQIDTLLQILDRLNMDSIISQSGCFVPRQSIILITNHKTSYIDICFHCDSYKVSKDLNDIPSFDNRKWTELREYFTTHGLTYELINNQINTTHNDGFAKKRIEVIYLVEGKHWSNGISTELLCCQFPFFAKPQTRKPQPYLIP